MKKGILFLFGIAAEFIALAIVLMNISHIPAVFNSEGIYETVEATVCRLEEKEDSESSKDDYVVYVKYNANGHINEIVYDRTEKPDEYKIGQKVELNISSKYPNSTVSNVISEYNSIFLFLNVTLIVLSFIDVDNKFETSIDEFNSDIIIKQLKKKKIIFLCSSAFFVTAILILNIFQKNLIKLLNLESYFELLNSEYFKMMPVFLLFAMFGILLKVYKLYKFRNNNLIIIKTICKNKITTEDTDSEGSKTKHYCLVLTKKNIHLEVSKKYYDKIEIGNKIGAILYKDRIDKFVFVCKFDQGNVENYDLTAENKDDLREIDNYLLVCEYGKKIKLDITIASIFVSLFSVTFCFVSLKLVSIIFLIEILAIMIIFLFFVRVKNKELYNGDFIIKEEEHYYSFYFLNKKGSFIILFKKEFKLSDERKNKITEPKTM